MLLRFIAVSGRETVSNLVVTRLLAVQSGHSNQYGKLHARFHRFVITSLSDRQLHCPHIDEDLNLINLIVHSSKVDGLVFGDRRLDNLLTGKLGRILNFFSSVHRVSADPLLA